MAKTRRTFTPEFKAEAVRRVTEQGKSLAEVARDLDLGESMLRAWKQALAKRGDHAFPGKGNPPAQDEELRRLRAEVKRLTMERDVLKKATASAPRSSGEEESFDSKPFIGTLRVTNPARQSRASSRKRVLRGGRATAHCEA